MIGQSSISVFHQILCVIDSASRLTGSLVASPHQEGMIIGFQEPLIFWTAICGHLLSSNRNCCLTQKRPIVDLLHRRIPASSASASDRNVSFQNGISRFY